jgi:hypothetical protein
LTLPRIEYGLLGCPSQWPSRFADREKGVEENISEKEEMTEWRELHKHELHN